MVRFALAVAQSAQTVEGEDAGGERHPFAALLGRQFLAVEHVVDDMNKLSSVLSNLIRDSLYMSYILGIIVFYILGILYF